MSRGMTIEKLYRILDQDDFISTVKDDLRKAKKQIIIYSPFIEPSSIGYKKLIEELKEATGRGAKVKVIAKN